MRTLRVGELFDRKREILNLELIAGEAGLEREITGPDVSSPGLVVTGFTERFAAGRLQVLGETEIAYMGSLTPADLKRAAERFLGLDIPCVFVTKGLDAPRPLAEAAERAGVPLIRTALKTGEFYRRIKPYLEQEFAPTTDVHGSLADVYGVGLLFVGESGIGKSETVLDLVERGHRLVADDVVRVTRQGNDVLIGRGHELQMHHMEIRGIGIIDVKALFGIRAIRQQKRIEVQVHLERWSDQVTYDRTGLDKEATTILDVSIPRVLIPLNPGKNITVISEVIAMNHLLKYTGVDSAFQFSEGLRHAMRPVREYLEQDYE